MKALLPICAIIALTGCEVGTDFYQKFTQEHNSTNVFYCNVTGYIVEESVTIRSNASKVVMIKDSNGSYVPCCEYED